MAISGNGSASLLLFFFRTLAGYWAFIYQTFICEDSILIYPIASFEKLIRAHRAHISGLMAWAIHIWPLIEAETMAKTRNGKANRTQREWERECNVDIYDWSPITFQISGKYINRKIYEHFIYYLITIVIDKQPKMYFSTHTHWRSRSKTTFSQKKHLNAFLTIWETTKVCH